MLIWLAMLIPVITAYILYNKYHRETVIWEFALPFALSVILCICSKALIEKIQTTDTEYWSGWAVKAEYYEDWDEEVPCRHSKYERDAKGNSRYVGNEHAYDVDYHPPYWQVIDSNGLTVGINSNQFDWLCNRFGNRQFVDLHRNYHSNDGDRWDTTWNGNELVLEPVITAHWYENRVQASNSVFKFPKVDKNKFNLYDYPRIENFYHQQSILGVGDISQESAEEALQKWNAKIGSHKQVRLFIVIFQNKPVEAGYEQQSYWQGGNKNEFVVTIGTDGQNNIQWCHPFSWSEVESLKIETRDFVNSQQTLNLEQLVEWLIPQIRQNFVRKKFSDFNYLTVEPPMWAVMLTFLIVIASNIGLAYWIVTNEHKEDGPPIVFKRRRSFV